MPVIAPTVGGVPVNKLAITWRLGQPESISYEARGPGASSLVGRGGVLPCSFGGAVVARLLSNGAQVTSDQPGTVGEQGSSTGQALATTHIGRLCGQQIMLRDLFMGKLGTIRTHAGGSPVPVLPNAQGIAHTPIGDGKTGISYSFRLDGAIAGLMLDIDINRDNVLHAIQMIAERLGSTVDPQRAQFYIDSGTQQVVIGQMGNGPGVAFQPDPSKPYPILLTSFSQTQHTQQYRSVSFQGGDTHHGIPDGGRLTDIQTLNDQQSDATGNYRSGLPVISIYVNRDRGGAYYLPGDGGLHPMSQAMGVVDLWYDETVHLLYAATDAGVYCGAADPGVTAPWARLGGMALNVLKVCKEGDYLFALCVFQNGGAHHVLRYPGSSSGLGYDGWDALATVAGCYDFAVAGGLLYMLAQSAPNQILYVDGDQRTLPNADAYPVGLDVISPDGSTVTGVVVRTDQGSAALYHLAPGVRDATPMAGDGSLVDDFGAPVMVNEIRACGPGTLLYTGGALGAALLAATSTGVFLTADKTGASGWRGTAGQSNLGGIDVQHVAVAPPRAWLGQMLTRVWAINDQAIYLSPNIANWVDITAEPLTAGPAFFAEWKAQHGVYPDNVATTLSYGGYQLVRSLNGIGEFDYVLVNPKSSAPAGAHKDAEIAEISTPALIGETTASYVLLDAMVRYLAYTSRPQTIAQVVSYADDAGDALLRLRPTHDVSASGAVGTLLVDGSDGGTSINLGDIAGTFYVLEHTIDYDADRDPTGVQTTSRLGTLLLDDRSDPTAIVADMWYAISRQSLYRGRLGR